MLSLLMSIAVTVSNPLNQSRTNVPVVIDVPTDAVNAKSVTVDGVSGVCWQLDDLNEDGKVDELVLMLPYLGANATEKLQIEFSEAEAPQHLACGSAAMMRLNDKSQKHPDVHSISFPGTADPKFTYNCLYGHGAILEGVWSAIRVYIDNRQSVDLYLKRTPKLELDTTFFYTTKKQLQEEGFGRDVLWAGTSVALGSFRGMNEDGTPQTIDNVRTRAQRVVASGPLRSIIEVVDRGWVTPQGQTVDMVQRYTMFAFSRDFDVEIQLTPATDSKYLTGIQKLAIDNEGFSESVSGGVISGSWGTNVPDNNMSDLSETIGLGIFVSDAYQAGQQEDELNYLTYLHPDADGIIRYTFTATGLLHANNPITNIADWQAHLRHWSILLSNPIAVKIF